MVCASIVQPTHSQKAVSLHIVFGPTETKEKESLTSGGVCTTSWCFACSHLAIKWAHSLPLPGTLSRLGSEEAQSSGTALPAILDSCVCLCTPLKRPRGGTKEMQIHLALPQSGGKHNEKPLTFLTVPWGPEKNTWLVSAKKAPLCCTDGVKHRCRGRGAAV